MCVHLLKLASISGSFEINLAQRFVLFLLFWKNKFMNRINLNLTILKIENRKDVYRTTISSVVPKIKMVSKAKASSIGAFLLDIVGLMENKETFSVCSFFQFTKSTPTVKTDWVLGLYCSDCFKLWTSNKVRYQNFSLKMN